MLRYLRQIVAWLSDRRDTSHFQEKTIKKADKKTDKKSPRRGKQSPDKGKVAPATDTTVGKKRKRASKHRVHCQQVSANDFKLKKSQFDDDGIAIATKLQKSKYDAYFVGGCVRDLLLGVEPKDFDLVTDASPDKIKQIFGRRCRLIGRRFRLAHLLTGKTYIEVATFRRGDDGASSTPKHKAGNKTTHDKQNQNIYGTIEDDAFRRDFTINALFYEPASHTILDFTNGLQDIEKRQIKMIGDVKLRIDEDPVRILRAIRFESKLGFTMEDKIKRAIADQRHLLLDINRSRIFDELFKFFHSAHAVKSVAGLLRYQILGLWMPRLVSQIETYQALPRATAPKSEETAGLPPLIHAALANSEERYQQGKSLNPGFLIAVFLWSDFHALFAEMAGKLKRKKNPARMASSLDHQRYRAASLTLSDQRKTMQITNNLYGQIIQMWQTQWQLESFTTPEAVEEILTERGFRASYDFFVLRANTEAKHLKPLATWWTHIQTLKGKTRDAEIEAYCQQKSKAQPTSPPE